jgi:hypothetical protein
VADSSARKSRKKGAQKQKKGRRGGLRNPFGRRERTVKKCPPIGL